MPSVKKIRLSIAAATLASAFVIGGAATANASPDINGSENGPVASAASAPQPASRVASAVRTTKIQPGPRPSLPLKTSTKWRIPLSGLCNNDGLYGC